MPTASFFKMLLIVCVIIAQYVPPFYQFKIKDIKETCAAEYTCESVSGLDEDKKPCRCDEMCSMYGDCCYNYKKEMENKSPFEFICQKTANRRGVYMVDACTNPRRMQFCHRDYNPTRQVAENRPVINLITNVTFRHQACAHCDQQVESLELYDIVARCPRDILLAVKYKNVEKVNFHYYRNLNSWGVFEKVKAHMYKFHPCIINYKPPDNLKQLERLCDSSLISICSSKWNIKTIASSCSRYSGPVYIDNIGYKNYYCAVCNYKDITKLNCTEPKKIPNWEEEGDGIADVVQVRYYADAGKRG